MSLLNISFYVLVGLGVLGVIFAIVWTKFIKPDTNTDKLVKLTSFPLIRLKSVIKKISKKNPHVYYNLIINKSEEGLKNKGNIFVPGIIISEKIYLLSQPIFTNKDVKYKNGKYLWKDKEDLKFELWFNRTSAFLADKLGISSDLFELIIPVYKEKNMKKIKHMKSFKDISANPNLKLETKVSKEIFKLISNLNVINFKKAKWVR